MNGAESLIRTAQQAGVDVCFTNPGTTEMHLVAALDSVPGVRAVLGLFEGVVTGAADGYGRMAQKPAMTLLHLGPGFANGIANLHNARRAHTPIVNLIGHHATWQRNYDPPLNSDVEQLAAPVSSWVRTSASSDELSRDVADAISASWQAPGQISTLVVPGDCAWGPAGEAIVTPFPAPAARVGAAAIESAREALSKPNTLLLLGSTALLSGGLIAAGRIGKHTGQRLASETFGPRTERGPGLPALARLPYFPEQAQAFFEGVERVVLAGAKDPVAFFGYEDGVRRLIPESIEVIRLATPHEDVTEALELLAEALGAGPELDSPQIQRPPRPEGALSPTTIAQAIVATQPEDLIVMDEGVTSAGAYYPVSQTAPPHTYLQLTGGAIGLGLPAAAGAALAAPERKVLALEGDGSGLYTVQALWTQARENLDVVNLIFANNVYKILQVELHRAGVEQPGPQSLGVTELSKPRVSWTDLAKSFGVPACSVDSAEELTSALERAFAEPGPHLIEARIQDGPVAVP